MESHGAREKVVMGNTTIILELKVDHVIPEFQPVAQITLRQIYESAPPKWYVWVGGTPNGPSHTLLGHFSDYEEALRAANSVLDTLTSSPKGG